MNIIIIIIVIIIILVLFYLLKNKKQSNDECTLFIRDYLTIDNKIPSIDRNVYQKEWAKILYELSWNITVSNCSNSKIMLPDIFEKHKISNKGKTFAYLLIANSIGILVFTGIAFKDEWKLAFEFNQVSLQGMNHNNELTKGHKGFYTIYMNIRKQINNLLTKSKFNNFFITGNSMGGALATLASFDYFQFSPIVYTFAAPRSVNVEAANIINTNVKSFWRIFNTEDIIVNNPPALLGYMHAGNDISFTKNLNSLFANHSTAYEEFLLETHT